MARPNEKGANSRMRLIDADMLIEEVKSHNYCRRCPYSDECYVADDEQITCEKFMIADIEEQPTVNEWIPVSERLPEDLQPVNIVWVNHDPAIYYEHIKDKPLTATGVIYKGKWYWWSQYVEAFLSEYGKDDADEILDGIEIIAWMPIEPYKE